MKQLLAAILGSALLSNCVTVADAVRDSKTAIEIGRKECDKGTSENIISQVDPPDSWHARLSGDYWKVWSGSQREDDAFMEISVAKRDGSSTECVMIVR